MNGLYTSLSRTYLLAKKRRTAMTVIGIALGVTMVTAVALTTAALVANYRSVLEGIGGRAELQVTSIGGLGFPAAIRDEVAVVPGVRAAVPAVSSGAPVLAGERKAAASFYGILPDQEALVRDYRITDGRLPLAAGELAITDELAERLSAGPGDTVQLLSTAGFAPFTVVGVFRAQGTVRGTLGPFGVLPLAEAQRIFGRPGKLDTVDLLLEPQAKRAEVKARVEQVLAGRARAGTPADRARDMDSLLDSLIFALGIAGSISLFSGGFIIYTNVGMGVTERRRELSVLRALGMRRGEVVRLVLGEAALMGAAGAAIGLLLGYGLAVGMVEQLTRQFLAIYGIEAAGARLGPANIAAGLAVGIGVAVFAAWGPSRETVAISPVEAMRQGELTRPEERHGLRRALIGGAITMLAGAGIIAVWTWGDLSSPLTRQIGGGLLMAFLLGIVVLMPVLLPLLNRWLLRPLAQAMFGFTGRLATDNLMRHPRRTAATASALMVSLTFMVAMGGFAAAQRATLEDWFRQTVGWDLLVSSSYELIGAQVEMDPAFVEDLRAVSGVRIASPQRFSRIIMGDGAPAFLQVFDHTLLPMYSSPPLDQGDWQEGVQRLQAGGAVMISTPLADRLGLGMGDELELLTPSGPQRFRIVGIQKELAPFGGTVHLDRRDYVTYWNDQTVTVVALVTEDGADPAAVQAEIMRRYGAERNLTVQTNQGYWDAMMERVAGFYRLMDGLIWVSILVSGLAIANTLFSGLLERRREFGILRATGARRAETMRVVVGEALSTGAVGGLFGLGAGLLMFLLMVQSSQQFNGTAVDLRFPWVATLTALGVALILAPMVGLLPARWAARMDVVEALRYE